MLVLVIVVSVAAISLLAVAWRIDMRARREGRMTGVDESKMRTRTTPKDPGSSSL
jgi:hypothetical protein